MVLFFLCYLSSHLLLYAAFLRHRQVMSSEKGILLYHMVPALFWTATLGVLCALGIVSFAQVVLVSALHGIYSLTFLELWALADGGYSLAIMDYLEFRRDLDEQTILSELVRLGTAKKQERVVALLRMGFVASRDQRYCLTRRGRLMAAFISFIVRIAKVSMSH